MEVFLPYLQYHVAPHFDIVSSALFFLIVTRASSIFHCSEESNRLSRNTERKRNKEWTLYLSLTELFSQNHNIFSLFRNRACRFYCRWERDRLRNCEVWYHWREGRDWMGNDSFSHRWTYPIKWRASIDWRVCRAIWMIVEFLQWVPYWSLIFLPSSHDVNPSIIVVRISMREYETISIIMNLNISVFPVINTMNHSTLGDYSNPPLSM